MVRGPVRLRREDVRLEMRGPKADYGIDAPAVVRNLVFGGVIVGIAGALLYGIMVPVWPIAGTLLSVPAFVSAACLLVTGGLMVWSSKYGKLRERERLIDTLGLAGSEKVVDVGCGRGLLLIGVARRLRDGRAFGIDLWQSIDQSGNTPEATMANAKAEGVADRVDIRTADMRDLPFPDGSMDCAISSIAIHNVPGEDGRAKAITEIARVLKAGGRLAIQDLHATGEYVKTLRDLGWKDVEVSGLNFMIFPPVRIVLGRKPETIWSSEDFRLRTR
jgi:SAM-dependent methyltransferase